MIPEKQKQNEKKYSTFGYVVAWIAFLSSIGMAVYGVLKDKKPPNKDDY